jgi:hypothetical protein
MLIIFFLSSISLSCSSGQNYESASNVRLDRDGIPVAHIQADTLYQAAIDSLIPTTLGQYVDEVSYRYRQTIINLKEYSFVFRRSPWRLPFTQVLISEAVGNSIHRQLYDLYLANPNLPFREALAKIKVRHTLLTADKYPQLDTLMSSITRVKFSVPMTDPNDVYLDPAVMEFKIRIAGFQSQFTVLDPAHPLVSWGESVKQYLDRMQ